MVIKEIAPTCSDVKTKLTNFDRANLLALEQGLAYGIGYDVNYLFSKYGPGD